nr:ribosomal protein L7/L12 [Mycoplasmopsis bovis]
MHLLAEAEEKKSTLSVILKSDNGKKLAIVKAVKELLNLALMDANKLVSTLPATLKENIPACWSWSFKS